MPRDSEQEEVSNALTFENAASAIRYCADRLETGWKDTLPPSDTTQKSPRRRHLLRDLNKWQLFRRDGAGLTEALTSGQAPFDTSLNLVRLDR